MVEVFKAQLIVGSILVKINFTTLLFLKYELCPGVFFQYAGRVKETNIGQ
jgi:hypothetical protein